MIKSRIVLPIIFTLIVVALFFSCDPSSSEPGELEKSGTLIIRVGEGGAERSIEWEPEVLMEIDCYEISGRGPEERTFSGIRAEKGERVVISNLREGSWVITATGYNKDNQAVGEGVESVTILAGREVEKSILVTEFTGEGSLSITVDWPAQELADPNILVTLNKPTGGEVVKYTLSPGENGDSATLLKEVAAGYYLLTLSIYDGSTSDINNKLTGVSGTIRVLANYTTLGSFTFVKEDLRVFGDVKVSISEALTLPFELTLNQDRESVWAGLPITFTATPNIGGNFDYYWYLNGELLEDENSDTLHLETTLLYGKHHVGVAASRQGVLASKLTSFLVIEEPQAYFTVRLFEEGTNTLAQQFDLFYTVPNLTDFYRGDLTIEIEDFKPLEFRKIVYKEGEEIVSEEFIINGFDRIHEDGLFNTEPLLEDFTFSVIFIEDFTGKGTYQLYGYDEEDYYGSALFEIVAIQVELDGYPNLGKLVSDYNEGGGTLEILEFGEVGGYVRGDVAIQKVPMLFFDLDSFDKNFEYFNLEASFNLIRDEDIVLTRKTITFVYEENSEITEMAVAGRIEFSLLREAAYKCMKRAPENGVITGWSLEKINGEEAYDVYDPFLVPDTDLTLYAIWEGFD